MVACEILGARRLEGHRESPAQNPPFGQNRAAHQMNPNNTLADQVNATVLYLGENAQGSHMFGNGSNLATHIFEKLSDGATRFGRRIDTRNREFIHSGPYASGQNDAAANRPYNPTRSYGRAAVVEYATGYLRALVEKIPLSQSPNPVLTEAEHNALRAKMARGRS